MTAKVPSARAQLDRSMSEDDLLSAIVEAALFLGWRVHHDRRSDKALQQGSPGFPDLVLARRGRVVFAELKSDRGHLSPDQFAWALALDDGQNPGVGYHTWRSADLDAALAELR